MLPGRANEAHMHGKAQAIFPASAEQSVQRVEALARLMDGAIVLPGTNIRLGVDAVTRI